MRNKQERKTTFCHLLVLTFNVIKRFKYTKIYKFVTSWSKPICLDILCSFKASFGFVGDFEQKMLIWVNHSESI